MTLFLHVGFPKTGTTSIQTTLHRASDMLRKNHSINYPKFASNHWMIALPFLGNARWGRLDRQLKRTTQSHQDLLREGERLLEGFTRTQPTFRHGILSSEHFISLGVAPVTGLVNHLRSIDRDVKVVVYVRHPADELSSRLQQNIKTGARHVHEIDRVDNKSEAELRRFLDIVGKENIVVKRFGSQYFFKGELIEDFLSIVDPNIPFEKVKKQRRNESLSAPAFLIIDQFYKISGRNQRIKNRKMFEGLVSGIRGPKFLAPRYLVDRYVKDHQGYLEFLSSEFGIVFDPVDMDQFPERLSYEFSDDTLRSIAEVMLKGRSLTDPPNVLARLGRTLRRAGFRWL